LSAIWGQYKRSDTVQSVSWYVKSGKLKRIRRGLYAIDRDNLDPYVVANKAVTPSYVTGFTILIKHGLSFQVTNTIHSAALKSQTIKIDDIEFIYHGIKEDIFRNDIGIEKNDDVSEASLERAVVDVIYYSGGRFQFEDYLDGIDWVKLRQIGRIYGKKSMMKALSELEKKYVNNS
jgi:predicted transcriptional regulator of viral defense system